MSIKEKQDRLPTLYWLPKLHKRPYKARFIANSSSCTTTVLSKLLTSCLTAVKKHWIRYYDTVYERDGINYFSQLKILMMFSINLNLKTFRLLNCLHMIDFSTLYTTLPHHLIKDKLIDLINRTFIRENTQYLACNEECAFFTSDVYNNHNLWSCQKVCGALVYLLDNIFIRFGIKLYRQTIGIPMRTNCAPLVADLFLFCYERDFMTKKVRETSRECHNHKPQPFPDTKRKRKPTNPNKHKSNKRTKSTKISSLFPKRGNRNTKRTEKHKNKMTHGKTYNKSPRRINHKATKSKTNTGKSLSRENQADIIEAFNSTSRYLDDLLNIDNIYFDQMVDRIYPTELQLNRVNSSDAEAPFLDLNLCISNGTVSTKIYDKRDDFDWI